MGFFRQTTDPHGQQTAEEVARRLRAGPSVPVHVDTADEFHAALGVMLRTGRPVSVPDRASLDAWFGPVDELPDDELETVEAPHG